MEPLDGQSFDVEHPFASEDIVVFSPDHADGVVVVVVVGHQDDVRRHRRRFDADGASIVGIDDHCQPGVSELEARMTVPSDPHAADIEGTCIKNC